MTDAQWNQFMEYAEEFARSIDLDAMERDDKVKFVERMQASHKLFKDEDPNWFESLRKSLASTNLLSWWFRDKFARGALDHIEELHPVLHELWREDVDFSELDRFADRLRTLIPDTDSVGGLVALESLLLMTLAPTRYVPYMADPAKKFMKLIGWTNGHTNGTPTERYGQLLDALDEMQRRANERGLPLRDRLDAQGLMWTVIKSRGNGLDFMSTERRREFSRWRGDKVSASEPTLTREFGPVPEVEKAAWLIIDAGIAGRPSPLDAKVVTWTEENARELLRLMVEEADYGNEKFVDKMKGQLVGASRGVVLLATELVILRVLPVDTIRASTKISEIESLLSCTSPTPELADGLLEGIEGIGTFGAGRGFNSQKARHLVWLCKFIINLRTNSELDEAPLDSPLAFHSATASTPHDIPSIRYCLEYLAWPSFFQPVVSRTDRIQIRDAFAHEIGGASGSSDFDISTDLYHIRRTQQERSGGRVLWYSEPYVSQWKGSTPALRAWLVRQNQSGTSLVEQWIREGFVSTKATHLGSPEPGSSLEDVQAAVSAGYDHLDYAERQLRAKDYYLFLSHMKEGDLVLTAHDDRLFLGVISGETEYTADESSRLRRTVEWQDETIRNENLPVPLETLLREPGNVVELTAAMSLIKPWLGREKGTDSEIADTPVLQAAVVPKLRSASDDLAADLHVGREHLQEMIDLLQVKNQIVFYGPPGTGKTYLAGKLARFLVGKEHADHVTTVQLHPSYAYEDFFEGYRPTQSKADGGVAFSLQAGPLRRIAAEAASEGNRDKPYFLIIDEMNRGNLAKVFGELYFLLEYRNESITLQYNSSEKFVLPPNLFIIGTMNTADRSIAMVDAAIRRRFAFVELHPQEAPIEGVLERYLLANNRDVRPARLLDALNREIEQQDRDFMIGPSYFMTEQPLTPEGLRRIWKYELMPLLEEHYFGRSSREEVRARFDIARLDAIVAHPTDELGRQ